MDAKPEWWKVGAKVVVRDGDGKPSATATVARVLAQYVELSNGSRWGADGRRKPRESAYRRAMLVAHTSEIDGEIRRAKAVRLFVDALEDARRRVGWDRCSLDGTTEQIDAATAMLRALAPLADAGKGGGT